MGKRGRPPKSLEERKSRQTSIRFKDELLSRLKRESVKNKRSVADEIAKRLELSFDKVETFTEALGGSKTYAFLRLVSLALHHLREMTGHGWLDDRFTFDRALEAIAELVDQFKPAGSGAVPTDAPIVQTLMDHDLSGSKAEALKTAGIMTLGKSSARYVWMRLLGTALGKCKWDESKVMKRISDELRSVIERHPDHHTLRQGLANLPPKSKRTRT